MLRSRTGSLPRNGRTSEERGDGLATIPFDWELVDAYHLMERFARARVRRGDTSQPLRPEAVSDRLCFDLATGSGTQVLVLHPFLMLDPLWWKGVRRVLALIAQLNRERQAWTGPGGELAKAGT